MSKNEEFNILEEKNVLSALPSYILHLFLILARKRKEIITVIRNTSIFQNQDFDCVKVKEEFSLFLTFERQNQLK